MGSFRELFNELFGGIGRNKYKKLFYSHFYSFESFKKFIKYDELKYGNCLGCQFAGKDECNVVKIDSYFNLKGCFKPCSYNTGFCFLVKYITEDELKSYYDKCLSNYEKIKFDTNKGYKTMGHRGYYRYNHFEPQWYYNYNCTIIYENLYHYFQTTIRERAINEVKQKNKENAEKKRIEQEKQIKNFLDKNKKELIIKNIHRVFCREDKALIEITFETVDDHMLIVDELWDSNYENNMFKTARLMNVLDISFDYGDIFRESFEKFKNDYIDKTIIADTMTENGKIKINNKQGIFYKKQ